MSMRSMRWHRTQQGLVLLTTVINMILGIFGDLHAKKLLTKMAEALMTTEVVGVAVG